MGNWHTKLNADPVPWLLESNPWTRFRTLADLQEFPASNQDLAKARAELLAHDQVQQLAEEVKDWISIAPTRYNDAKISYFKLRILRGALHPPPSLWSTNTGILTI